MSKIANTRPGEMALIGCLGILNVGEGDTKLSFDPNNPEERERAAKIVTDMLRRGFAIMVQVGEKDGKPLFQRAEAFDEKTCEYIIFELPPDVGAPALALKLKTAGGRRGRAKRTRLSAAKTRGVAVARSAGG